MTTFASIFTGGGLADIGASIAGCDVLWGIELDSEIHSIAKNNFSHDLHNQDVLDVDWESLRSPDILWASPPCPNYSSAKAGATETALDIEISKSISDAIEMLSPQAFVLENVSAYKHSSALELIEKSLFSSGYFLQSEVLNSADFNVPQQRKRLILRAIKGMLIPPMPPPSNWLGWYQAIEDIVPNLRDSELAQWQLDRLKASIDKTPSILSPTFIGGSNSSSSFLEFAVANRKSIPGVKAYDAPIPTVPASDSINYKAKAIISDRPCLLSNTPEYLLISGQLSGKDYLTLRTRDCPSMTVVSSSGTSMSTKAIVKTRIVNMSPRCMARFQSLPDWYKLPEKKSLAFRIIGNGVPCQLAKSVITSLIPYVDS